MEANAFQAIGKSWPGFWIFFLRFVVLAIPLAYVMTYIFRMPISGVWTAIMIGNIVPAVAGYVWITRTLKHLKLSDILVR